MSELERRKEMECASNELIKIIKERETVRNLLIARNAWITWSHEKFHMRDQLEEIDKIIRRRREPIDVTSYPYLKPPYKRLPNFLNEENIVEFCIGLMMVGNIDEKEIVLEWFDFIRLLEKVTGEFKPLAEKIKKFLSEEYISDYYDDSQRELVKILFS